MKIINIYIQDIIPNAKYMCDADGRCDLLGQLLTTGYGIRLPPKTRTPQELNTAIQHFVIIIRGYVYALTPLALQLLANASLPPRKQITLANELLKSVNIQLNIVEEPSHTPPPQRSKLVTATPNRLSRFHCICGQSMLIDNLLEDLDDDGNECYCCNYCHGSLDKKLTTQIMELLK